jgi:hypothetical protein
MLVQIGFLHMQDGVMQESTLRELSKHGAVLSVKIDQVEGGYSLKIQTATAINELSLYRGGTRIFRTVDAAIAVVQSCGFGDVMVSWSAPVSDPVPVKVLPPSANKRTPPKKKRRK